MRNHGRSSNGASEVELRNNNEGSFAGRGSSDFVPRARAPPSDAGKHIGAARHNNGTSTSSAFGGKSGSASIRGSSSFMSSGHSGVKEKPRSIRDHADISTIPLSRISNGTSRASINPVQSQASFNSSSGGKTLTPRNHNQKVDEFKPERENYQKESGMNHKESKTDRALILAQLGASSSTTNSLEKLTPPQPHSQLRGCPPPENYILRQWMKGPANPEGTLVNVSDRPSLCMSVRGTEACIGSSDHALYIVDCQSCTFVRALYGKQYGHTEWVTCCDYLHDGRILSGGMDGKLCLWDKKGVRSYDLKGHSASISAVKGGAEGSLAVSSSYDKTLMLWDLSRLQTKSAGCLKAHKGAVLGFCLSSQGSIVSGSREGEVILWDAGRGTPLLHVNNAHEGHVTSVECIEDTKHKAWEECREIFLTGGQDGILQVWDFRTKGAVQTVPLHRNALGKGAVSCIAVSYTATGSGPIVVTAGADNTLKVTEPRKGFEVLHTLSSHRDFIYSLYVSGPLAWSGGGDGSLLVHELLTGQCLYGLGADAKGAVRGISLAGPDRLVAAGDDGNVMIYSL